jgi:hypothetical protein
MAGALGLSAQLRIEDLSSRLRGQRLQEVAVEVLRTSWDVGRDIHYREWFDLVRAEQLSNVVDLAMKDDQAATLSSVVWSSWFSSSVTLMPSLNFMPSSTSATSSWPLNRRQRSCADSSSL